MSVDVENLLSDMERELPVLVARSAVERITGGLLSGKTLANADSEGTGPERVYLGRKVAYPRKALLEWMRARLTVAKDMV